MGFGADHRPVRRQPSVSALLFIWREHYAEEPILPLSLFKNSIFSVTTLLSFLIGMVMFGALIFLPEYQQIVRGDSATKSGLMLLPLVAGLMVASIDIRPTDFEIRPLPHVPHHWYRCCRHSQLLAVQPHCHRYQPRPDRALDGRAWVPASVWSCRC